jgi:osmotically-inducible protein OsmY
MSGEAMSSRFRRRAALAGAAATLLSGCGPAAVVMGAGALTAAVAEDRTTADQVSDLQTKLTVQHRLNQHDPALGAGLAVDVHEGRVLLTGSVADPQQAIEATRIAWTVPGVVEVTNEASVGGPGGIQRFAGDMWISTQVRSRLMTDGRVQAVNYNVETYDGVVHLMGLARSTSELARATDIASSTPGVREVVSHVLLIDDPRRRAP